MISILILTLDEEKNIAACLKSVAWSDDVVVLDSGSSDGTVKIAAQMGAKIKNRKFDNFASQQNWAIQNIKFKNPWVFYLDADERITPELKEEILRVSVASTGGEVAYFCGRRNFFWGKWIRHSFPPSNILRFFKPDKVCFNSCGHAPVPVIAGSYGYLQCLFDHYNFSKGLEDWFAKHNRYSSQEAQYQQHLIETKEDIRWGDLISKDAYRRRTAGKGLFLRLPFRPLLKFIYLYFFKLGILDGLPGLTYCILQGIYEYQVTLKMKEIRLMSVKKTAAVNRPNRSRRRGFRARNLLETDLVLPRVEHERTNV